MKKIKFTYFVLVITVLTILLLAVEAKGQNFTVEKISGTVQVMKGTSEELTEITKGDLLSGSDVLITDENSFIQLSSGSSNFILRSNSALGLNHIKKVSINDLLLALTMEEIRNLPKSNSLSAKSTAVYGSEIKQGETTISENSLGQKKLNGAMQLAESGFKESAIIAANETYRKHPSTRLMINERIYFADLLFELNLLNEALEEYQTISDLDLSDSQNGELSRKIEAVTLKISNSK
jgi:hypothetical protein